MEKWTFKNTQLLALEKKFGIRPTDELLALSEWIKVEEISLSEEEKYVLRIFQHLLRKKALDWNEQELSMHFIGPIFSLVGFVSDEYNSFAGRDFGGVVGEIEFSGKPDEMIASGRLEPEVPYFFLQEYKQESDPNGDPLAQVLAAMLVAQTKNEDGLPIYGGYVKGRNWFFMVLVEKKYCISLSYDATKEELFDIFKILKKLKVLIEKRLENK